MTRAQLREYKTRKQRAYRKRRLKPQRYYHKKWAAVVQEFLPLLKKRLDED